ncbi:uncharacterized protein LOC125233866 isoform X2 [Leguminivora glycinivorella]|nr:uncharacterized protein LOC125233866 isoform X2 [Leguminivora glycinivorella]XP_047995969.1 uncharacterized protein LOC125233866 isoform X2 [Leguminivora glycinivorella]
MSVDERWSQASRLKLCHVCLRPDHETRQCKLNGCRVCKRRHNTYLHTTQTLNTSPPGASTEQTAEPANSARSDVACSSTMLTSDSAAVQNTLTASTLISTSESLLSTALIEVINPINNKKETVKCLVDSCSQSNYLSHNLRQKLNLDCQPLTASNVTGIGNTPLTYQPVLCAAHIQSKLSDFNAKIDFLVLDQVTSRFPQNYVDISHLNLPASVQLADPTFNVPSQIDMLLGVEMFWTIVTGAAKRLPTSKRTFLIPSKLGWLIAGPVEGASAHLHTGNTRSHLCLSDLSAQMTKFWETEELPSETDSIKNGSEFESHPINQHFVENTYRQSDGRFVVRLPLKDSPDCLGNSFNIAKKRLFSLEKRFSNQPELKSMYVDFINEYRDLGHLSESERCYKANHLPHHPVMKESESTRMRTVFHASCPTSSGYSINDIQLVGPNIQSPLFDILLRFRQYKYVLSGDIEKQYRQIMMNEIDRNLQVILWREDEHLPIRSLTLNTVTYGFASSSWLAARCLWQLGAESKDPLVRTIIQNDFYCDDLLTGADSEIELLRIQAGVSQALASGCFNLRKYRSNSNALLKSDYINKDDHLALSQACQTLGLGWQPSQDVLNFSIKNDHSDKIVTKRKILSETFQVFDPLGLLSLCTVKAKILIQTLWKEGKAWDEPVSPEIQHIWSKFIKNLHHIKSLSIPRYVLCEATCTIELHCFSDAAETAYAACIYVKSISESGEQKVHLLCARDRIAPIRRTSIPRLELAGCLLAAQTYAAVVRAWRRPVSRTIFWTDSSCCLAWLKTDRSKLKTFVANRVAAIDSLAPGATWRHVPTKQNPSDLATRGVDPQHVAGTALWWEGPEFLLKPENEWPELNAVEPEVLPETKVTSMLTTNTETSSIIDFDRFSKYTELQRTMAYVRRFINNCKPRGPKLTGALSAQELTDAFNTLIKLAQQESFSAELETLRKGHRLSPKSHILTLAPFIDSQGLLRVGGRLDASDCTYDQKHPMLLRAKHTLTKLIFTHEHVRLLHAGPQSLLASVRDEIWPIGGRNLARSTAHNCVTCKRIAGQTLKNIMGNLPAQRIKADFPFTSTAVDMAGPYLITDRRGRGCKITKCYLCLFICLRYKCVHIEAVSDLSKDAFVLALRRFIARRGRPAELFCDNGRNFVAAAKEINDFFKLYKSDLSEFAAGQGIKFKFAPAYAPNFNGYVEAGIRSAKFHLKRVLGNTHLTFEEIASLFSQVEAILNSRPLCPLSPSPLDFTPLTPGHFLIFRPLTSLPGPPLDDRNPHRLDRYLRLEQLRQHFWKRWSAEYVSLQQQRYKWRERQRDLQLGEVVLIKEEGLPPLLWRMGRVVKLYHGKDGVPRVADINTARGVIKRALNRICPLSSQQES